MPVASTFGGREHIPSHTHPATPMANKLAMRDYATDYSLLPAWTWHGP